MNKPAIRAATITLTRFPSRLLYTAYRARRSVPSALLIQGQTLRLRVSTTTTLRRGQHTATSGRHDKHEEVDYDGQLDEKLGDIAEKQGRTPWHREGADVAPVKRSRSASAMTKGKLLTTPSKLLKLVLPLTTKDKNSDRKDIEPLALLVHPTQPLSYLERLIQSELPLIKGKDGKDKIPDVYFRAEEGVEDELSEKEAAEIEDIEEAEDDKTGKIANPEDGEKKQSPEAVLRGGPGEGGVETYTGSPDSTPKNLVRWSSSTEIGDFIRDAARASTFAVEIEGASSQILVGVPSFDDRTHYLRTRLRKTGRQIDGLAAIKKECDRAAHKSAQRLAMSGFGVMVAWWGGTYYFTFMTDYGWDTMEPVTYLAGLSTIMLGYLYFLYHNREVSYRQALHMQISHKQTQLYMAKGFSITRWEALLAEANSLRNEIKSIAAEYDVNWDEKADEGSEVVHNELKKGRIKKVRKEEGEEGDEEVDIEDVGGPDRSGKGKGE